MGEFPGRRLAEQHAARGGQPRLRVAILRRHMLGQQPRLCRGADVLGLENILQVVGNTVHRPAWTAPHDLGLRRARLGDSALAGQGDEAVELRIRGVDAGEAGIEQLHGRDLAGRDQPRGLGQGEHLHGAHSSAKRAGSNTWAGSAAIGRLRGKRASSVCRCP